jgi:hypothetical protein
MWVAILPAAAIARGWAIRVASSLPELMPPFAFPSVIESITIGIAQRDDRELLAWSSFDGAA